MKGWIIKCKPFCLGRQKEGGDQWRIQTLGLEGGGGGGGGLDLLALLAFFPSVISFFFFTQNKPILDPPLEMALVPSVRSVKTGDENATARFLACSWQTLSNWEHNKNAEK